MKILRHINAESFLLIEVTGSWAHAARRMRPGASPGARVVIDPLEHIKKAAPKHHLSQNHLRFDGTRKHCPYSESMNPRRRSLTVVSFSSA